MQQAARLQHLRASINQFQKVLPRLIEAVLPQSDCRRICVTGRNQLKHTGIKVAVTTSHELLRNFFPRNISWSCLLQYDCEFPVFSSSHTKRLVHRIHWVNFLSYLPYSHTTFYGTQLTANDQLRPA